MPENSDSIDFFGLYDGYAPVEKYTQPKDDKATVDNLNKWLDRAYNWKRSYEREWELHRLYLKGEQMVLRHRDTGEIVRLSFEDSKRLRSMNNILRPIARALIGKLSKMIPTCTVLPATSDWAEMDGAKVADAILQFKRREQDLDTKYLDLMNFLPWAGNSFMQLVWDPSAGAKLAVCRVCDFYEKDLEFLDQPCPQCSSQRQQELQAQEQQRQTAEMQAHAAVLAVTHPLAQPPEIPPAPSPPLQQMGPLPPDQEPQPMEEAHEGDVRCVVRDPRDVFCPPGCVDIRQASRFCVQEAVEVAEARRRFSEFAPFIKREEGLFTDRMAQWRGNNLDTFGHTEWLDDHVWIREFHERPTELYPKGRLIHVINNMIVSEVEHPFYCLDRLPFYHFGFDKNDGEFWREPFIAQSWHRQRELNNVETQIREHTELLLKPKLLMPMGGQVSADEITPASAQIITYNAEAGPLEWMKAPGLDQGVWNRKADLVQDTQTQASVTPQEQGLESSDPNGRAMAIVNAEADQQIGPIVTRLHSEWRELHRAMLVIVQEKWHPDRKVTVSGPEGVQTFSFNELNLQPGWDIQIEEADGMSRNPAIRFNETLQLAQVFNGALFTDPRTGMPDGKKFARIARIKLPDNGYDTESMHRATAATIPYIIQQGGNYQPMPFDNAQIFAEVLEGWLVGPGRHGDPMVLQAVVQVWMYYSQWLMTGQMQPSGPMGGQAPQPGAGMSSPGGTPNNPGGLGTDLAGAQADQQVSQADAAGENLAAGLAHES